MAAYTVQQGTSAIELYKATIGGDPLRIRDDIPRFLRDGWETLTAADKDLLKWLGIFFRKPTAGKFMMRIRMPNGFTTSAQWRTIADLSRRLGNCVVDITTRQQIELRGFVLDSVPEIWERLRGVNLHSLQTGMDNVRNVNGCPLAGLAPDELLDASPVVFELDRMLVGSEGNPEFSNLPRKFNVTITGCRGNCTHNESQDIALVPAEKNSRVGFNVLVGGKMGSGGFTIASPLDVFVPAEQAAAVSAELIRIYRDHGPREARSKCRFSFLIDFWGIERLRGVLASRLEFALETAGADVRRNDHTDHLGVAPQKQPGLASVGLCIPGGRVDPDQMDELARLADHYGNGQIRLTTAQKAILVNLPAERVPALLQEPLLQRFSSHPSPFFRGMVACTGTDFCNLAQIQSKQLATDLSTALERRFGKVGGRLTMNWSGCPAGCGNHEAADLGFRGMKVNVGGKVVEAVAIYVGGRTGPHATAGQQVVDVALCDDSLPETVADVIERYRLLQDSSRLEPAPASLVQIDNSCVLPLHDVDNRTSLGGM